MNELVEFAKLAGMPTAVAGSALVGWLLYTRRLITRGEHEAVVAKHDLAVENERARTAQMLKERDEWQELCLGLLHNVERTGHAAKEVMQAVASAATTGVKKPDEGSK